MEPQPKKPRTEQQSITSIGQTTHNVKQDGYGKHMIPTISNIPIPIKLNHMHGQIKRSVWCNIDFCDTGICGYILPYHMLQFWVGINNKENNTINMFNIISKAAYGVTWHSFDLSIYNQATTRKRLLTQGSTTYETIDFETSQNLMILTDMNKGRIHQINWPDEYKPPGNLNQVEDWQNGTNYCKAEELATGHTKHFNFSPEKLPDSYVWQLLKIDNSGIYANMMFPARQHTQGYQTEDSPLVATNHDFYSSVHYQYKPYAMPSIMLDSPHIKSETGKMKFIYRTRWDFSIPYTLHMEPSSSTEKSYGKYIVPYPKAKKTKAKETDPLTYDYITTPSLH